jgi:hypothetical protein
MDPTVIIYYAIVCAGLSIVAPSLGRISARLLVGAGVGVAAALLLPVIRVVFGI